MRRNTLFSILLLFSLAVSAQDISVKSFRLLQGDMTASSLEGKRTDQNGQVAALIKVVTRETGFVFEGGALGIVGTQQKAGEIWVWVPRGLRKITILHQQLGGLRDYVFPENIEEGHTYEMVLTTAAIQTVVKEEEIPQQYLSFQLSPANATLVVNDEPWEVDASGGAMRIVDFGTYTYRVQAPNHYADAGRVTVDDPDNTTHVTVTLVPDCAEVTLKVDADAEIWVNNEKKGIRTWTGTLYSGTYSIECKMPNHESGISTQTITADMNGQTIMLPAPKTMYGSLNVETTPGNVTVFIDGKETGKTPLTVNELIIGSHEIRLAREGCADLFETVTIVKGEQSHVNHTMPLGCSIQFFCNVPDARLIVDGITYGSVAEGCNLTQGMHTLKVTAQGYNEFSGSINVTKNKMQHCITLWNGPQGVINAEYSISSKEKIMFSQGNLLYCPATKTWSFAVFQYDYVGGRNNVRYSADYNGWIDLFGCGANGYKKHPWATDKVDLQYAPSSVLYHEDYLKFDWGINTISNGVITSGTWQTLHKGGWEYLLTKRKTQSGIRFAKACVNSVNGLILLPDNWNKKTYRLKDTNEKDARFDSNVIDASQWSVLEQAGAVFLPAVGRRDGTAIGNEGIEGRYWADALWSPNLDFAGTLQFTNEYVGQPSSKLHFGLSVRLVYKQK